MPGGEIVREHKMLVFVSGTSLLNYLHHFGDHRAHVERDVEKTANGKADKKFILEGKGLTIPVFGVKLGTTAGRIIFT